MDKLKMESQNIVGSNINKIAQLFPNCVTERKGKDGKTELAIDFEKLQAELSDDIIGEGEERYQFTWPDKRAANRLANTPTTMTLRPCREDSVDFDKTQNIYIEGDNLDALKVLRETYLGKVKMIYIDPPYNTGNDFVYNDDFAKGKDKFEQASGFFDEEGNQTIDPMQRNTESNGRFHTDWLNMMYPRLKVARDLLTDDGVIFISIDDNELNNLRKICDEIFGSSNFEGTIIPISNPGGRDYKQIAVTNEYLIVYSKSASSIINEMSQEVEFRLFDSLGGFEPRELRNRNPKFTSANRPNLFYPFYVNPKMKDNNGYCTVSLNKTENYYIEVRPYNSYGAESVWRWGKLKASQNIVLDSIDQSQIIARQKNDGNWNIYEKCRKNSIKAKSVWTETEMRTENGTREVRALFNATYFDHPKPLGLIIRCCIMGMNTDDTVLDFFSGSATTAHSVMQLNAADGGNRKFIMVQLPEQTDEKSEAYKAGYKNICEIGKERIRRAGKKIKEDNKDKEGIEKLDTGFRVLKLDTSNMEDVYYTPQEFDEQKLFTDNVKADRTNEDLLFQVMLDLGIELSAKIEVKEIAGKTVHIVDENYLVACFDEDVNETTIKEIAKLKPVYFVMRDASAANDNVIDNFEQIFRHYSPETTCRIL